MCLCFLNTKRPLQRRWNFPYVDKSHFLYSGDDFIGFYFIKNICSYVIEINIEEFLIYKLKRKNETNNEFVGF